MSSQGTIHRYTLIIEKIKSRNFPSFQEIQEYLSDHGFEISVRTLQRDIEQIRVEFGAEIKYDRLRNGYFLDLSESNNLDSFFRLLEVVTTANLLTDNLREGKEALKYIAFETDGSLKGIEHLQSILFAVKNQRFIRFAYKAYDKKKQNYYELKPYLLKEYENRWYIIGQVEGDKFPYRTFGLDRIEQLEIKTTVFKRKKNENPEALFESIIGLTYSNAPVDQIKLSFTPLQGKYIKSLPLHPSQRIVKDNATELVITLALTVNFELIQKLLMYGERVKVLQPQNLADALKEVYKKALKQYK
jgi:predicted DNA-binding transcriptional regulator YafY